MNQLFHTRFWIALLAAILCLAPHCAAEEIAVRAVLEKTDPVAGEPVRLQIQVQGSDQTPEVDLTPLQALSPVIQGGGPNNRNSTVSINGRVTHNVFRGYLLTMLITPAKPGLIDIPALTVKVGGVPFQTRPLRLRVGSAEESPDFRLLMRLPRTTVYKGETVPVEFVWLIGKQPARDSFALSAPVLALPSLRVDLPDEPQTNNDRSLIGIPLNNKPTWGKIGQEDVSGKTWQTITVTRYLTPLQSGILELPPASISGAMIAGYEKTASPFGSMLDDDFFGNDPFFSGRQPVIKRFYAATDPVRLTVLELPAQGRPSDFSGLVGKLSIAAKIEPTEAAVGEPLTLTVMMTGAGYPNALELPDLASQPQLAAGFRLQPEKPDSKVIGGVKIFTQTIRPRSSSVKELPPLRLSYFDPEANEYRTAQSRPIALTIHEAKTVTARDIEGMQPTPSTATGSAAIVTAQEGIHHNYIDEDCLRREPSDGRVWLSEPFWIAFLCVPPLLWLGLTLWQMVCRYRGGDQDARRAATTLRDFLKNVQCLESAPAAPQLLLSALRTYFSQRLSHESAGIDMQEIEPALRTAGLDPRLLEELRKVFAFCEASAYSGGATGSVSPAFAESVRALIRAIHQGLPVSR